MDVDLIGWLASAVLLATLTRQIVKQWRGDDSLSRWLFIGQCAASAGFVLYSLLLGNWVFTVTNACLLLTAIVGWAIDRRRRNPNERDGGRGRHSGA